MECVRTFQPDKSDNIVIDRKQFPIFCAEAITIHKSQGGTYTIAAINPRPRLPRSALYVACSRATSANGLFIVGKFVVLRKISDDDVVIQLQYIREERPLIPRYVFLTECPENLIQILYHNVQSLQKHYTLKKMIMCLCTLIYCYS